MSFKNIYNKILLFIVVLVVASCSKDTNSGENNSSNNDDTSDPVETTKHISKIIFYNNHQYSGELEYGYNNEKKITSIEEHYSNSFSRSLAVEYTNGSVSKIVMDVDNLPPNKEIHEEFIVEYNQNVILLNSQNIQIEFHVTNGYIDYTLDNNDTSGFGISEIYYTRNSNNDIVSVDATLGGSNTYYTFSSFDNGKEYDPLEGAMFGYHSYFFQIFGLQASKNNPLHAVVEGYQDYEINVDLEYDDENNVVSKNRETNISSTVYGYEYHYVEL
ncbi:MAG: hypothetical protein KDC91_09160 [Flavobacteriaceae bacterium]|nr:hypothetical protein [Flavobacteriaceae bacterium]